MKRLTEKDAYWLGEEFWTSAREPDDEEIEAVYAKLKHYEDLEEQGKLVLFPRYAYFIKDRKIHKGWVQETVHAISRKPLYDIRYDDKSLANYRGYLGNTVFLTKEEAEAKRKEMVGANNDK